MTKLLSEGEFFSSQHSYASSSDNSSDGASTAAIGAINSLAVWHMYVVCDSEVRSLPKLKSLCQIQPGALVECYK